MLKFFKQTKQASPTETMRDRYTRLCEQRDETNKRIAPLQAKLDAANARVQQAQVEVTRLALEVSGARGGESWLALKKEIGILAKALSGIR